LVTNGPISRLDRVSGALARLPEGVLADAVLRPRLVERWLSSSAGLRRTVANPYVMDRDIVVMLTQAMTETADARRSTAQWLRSAAAVLPITESRTRVISALWGDDDVLYPLGDARRALAALGCSEVTTVSGARHHHPEERPWELADAVTVMLESLTTT
jgi:pimeloyl-ACP methyl ester carboxylesterase